MLLFFNTPYCAKKKRGLVRSNKLAERAARKPIERHFRLRPSAFHLRPSEARSATSTPPTRRSAVACSLPFRAIPLLNHYSARSAHSGRQGASWPAGRRSSCFPSWKTLATVRKRAKKACKGFRDDFMSSARVDHEPPFKRVVCSRPIRPRGTGQRLKALPFSSFRAHRL